MSAPTPTEPTHPAVGRVFGNYVVKAVLGEGGMGEVFVAEHQRLGRQVALKRLRDSFAKNRQAVKRFVDEAWAIGQIQHPNIVKVTDFVLADQDVYYIMELLEGHTLAEELKQKGPLAPARAVRIAREVALALAAVHSKGYVHSDINPSNIFLVRTPEGHDNIKLLDFGIASLILDNTAADDSGKPQLVTPVYMSPEQANRQSTAAAADLYSLGAVLYHMLVGSPPFEAATFAEYVYKHTQEPPTPLREMAPPDQRLSRELECVVLRCLEKAPSDRYPNASALIDALEQTPPQQARGKHVRDLLLGTDRTGIVTRLCTLTGVIALLVALLTGRAGHQPPQPTLSTARSPDLRLRSRDAGAARPRPPAPVVVTVQSEPPRAMVQRLSPRPRILGLTPLTLSRTPRAERWQLEVQLEGYTPQRLQISLTGDVQRRVVLQPVAQSPMAGPPPAGMQHPRRPPRPMERPRPVDPRGIINPFDDRDAAVMRR